MSHKALISVEDLKDMLAQGADVLVFDCEFELGAPDVGPALYRQGHIPTARYAHLDDDLAAPPDGSNGRHPLPAPVALSAWLRAQGLHNRQQVVAYDSHGGAWAARLWWLLRWLGHALLGSPQVCRWTRALRPPPLRAISSLVGRSSPPPRRRVRSLPTSKPARPGCSMHAIRDALQASRTRSTRCRGTSRARATASSATIWMPVATSARVENLRQSSLPCWTTSPPCGSGVTACHNALAMAVAGLPVGRLYPGSWSEWIADPSRPVATGID